MAKLPVKQIEKLIYPVSFYRNKARLTLENVVLAPHLGNAITETRTAIADLAVRNVIAVVGGGAPLTSVP